MPVSYTYCPRERERERDYSVELEENKLNEIVEPM